MTNLQKAEKLGYKVNIHHGRFNWAADFGMGGVTHDRYEKEYDSLYGGETLAYVYDDQGNSVLGVSECSIKDKFNRKLGVEIAVGRALKRLRKGK